ncbi:iron chaperone [Roseateles sp.]|uniref:iron chaperone n=1 Tax=Roseateles sp. TaxID=1971397 RepID=UPI0039217AEB
MTPADGAAAVEAYIARCAPEVQAVLRAVRQTVRHAAPQAEERISYQMPALFQHGAVVYYGAFKQHLGLYPPVVDEPALRERVARYAGPKGNLQFRYAEPLPLVLIADVVRARLAVNLAKAKPR